MDLQTDRLLVGQGYNFVTGAQCGMSVVFTDEGDLTTASGTNGQSVTFDYTMLESFEALEQRLNISAAASFGFGIFSADLSADFVRTGSFSQYNTFLFLDVTVTNPTEVLKRPMLTPAAIERAHSGQSAFLDFCGNSYVYGRQTGGQLTAIVQFSSTTQENYQSVKTRVSGSVAGYGSGTLKIDEAIKSLSNVSRTNIHIVRRGGLGAIPTLEDLANAARQFPTTVARSGGNPGTVAMLTREYNTVENFPANTIDLAALDRQARTLQTISSYLGRAYALRGDLRFVKENPDIFENGPALAPAVDAAFAANEAIIGNLFDAATAVRRDPAVPAPPPPNYPTVAANRRHDPPPVIVAPPPPIVEMFGDIGFGGRRVVTSSSINNFVDIGFNDILSSIRINGAPGEYLVEFFKDANYQQLMFSVRSPADAPNLHSMLGPMFRNAFGDMASSVRITKVL
jgi:hypothetical protein